MWKAAAASNGGQAKQATDATAPAFCTQRQQITTFVAKELSSSTMCDGLTSTIFIMCMGISFQI